MITKAYIAPSVLAADFGKLQEQVTSVEKGGADFIHIDIMDGHFVPNISFGPKIVSTINRITDVPLDVHLMISNPELYIEEFIGAGADYLTVHQESSVHCNRLLTQIRESGAKPGLSINPGTPVSAVKELLPLVDLCLLMSVNPGFGGQSFILSTLNKLQETIAFRKKHNLNFLTEMDGGIDRDNFLEFAEKGCNVLVAGSGIFKTDDPEKTTRSMKTTLREHGL